MKAFIPPINRDRLSELKSFFIGDLTVSSNVWVRPVKTPHVFFSGEGVAYQDGEWMLDYGDVPAVGTTPKTVCIENLGQEKLTLSVTSDQNWLDSQWHHTDQSQADLNTGDRLKLDAIFRGQEMKAQALTGTLRITAKTDSGVEKVFPLTVKLTAHTRLPYARFSFNGSPSPELYDFGALSPLEKGAANIPSYRLSVENRGTEVLDVSFDACPPWLKIFMINISTSRNKLEFQVKPGQTAVAVITPKPSLDFMGPNNGTLICQTNDKRKEYEKLELGFQCIQEIETPYISFDKTEPAEVLPTVPCQLDIPLYNRGKTPAHLAVRSQNKWIKAGRGLLVPGAEGLTPGKVPLHVSILADQQLPGMHEANLELTILNDSQPPIDLPLKICLVKIDYAPKILDFGAAGTKLSVTFKASNSRELFLEAEPVPELKDYLSVKVKPTPELQENFRVAMNPHLLEITLEEGGEIPEYEGPGIIVRESRSGYSDTIPVKFRRSLPVAEIVPGSVVDMGEIVGGTVAKGSFKILNKGDSVLTVKLQTDSADLLMDKIAGFDIGSGETAEVNFLLDLLEKTEGGQTLEEIIAMTTNEMAGEPPRIIRIRAAILRPEGKACPGCSLLIGLDQNDCPSCRTSAENAVPISEKNVVQCPACGRQYKDTLSVCPKDGKPLKANPEE
jgi:hypothetical protein